MITKGIKILCREAEKEIETIDASDAIKLLNQEDYQFIDIRDIRELWREGVIPNSFHAPRGMLEFWIDPDSPYHKELFAQKRQFVFFCAGGLRSALATKTAQDMGLKTVSHIRGGFDAWRDSGGPTEEKKKNLSS